MSRILLAGALLAVIFFLSLEGLRPPAPEAVDAPLTEFSAGRARLILNQLVGDGLPHPTGSPANAAVRERIIAILAKLGYQPEVQSGFACDEYGTCASVNNILARLEGKVPGPAVLLAAHYDSVPAGPGASDDGAGTATVLEIARALKTLPQSRNSIILLIDEGEEDGLIGARVFVDQHPWAKEIRAVVNVDTRGTSGASFMFETGTANAWAVRLYAKNAAHPATNSISYSVYKMLPNDTDFTIFKAAGYQGLNFAYIGDVAQYHTPLDNFENADPASLQHDGDNALPSLLALAQADLANPPQGEAVYFDLFGHWVIRWPANSTRSIAGVTLIFLLLEIAWLNRRKRLLLRAYIFGLLVWPVMLITTTVIAGILQWTLRKAGAVPVNWLAHPLPILVACWSLAIAVVALISLRASKRAGFSGLWAGTWSWWTILAFAIAWLAPGFSYLLLLPSCVAVLVALPFVLHPRKEKKFRGLVVLPPVAVAAILGVVPAIVLYAALGVHLMHGIALLVCLVMTTTAPLASDLDDAPGLSRLGFYGIPAVVAILAAFAAFVVPAYSAKSPERVNLQYWQDGDSGRSQWIVHPASGRLPEPISVATSFRREEHAPFPWDTRAAFLADAPHLDRSAPTFTILESEVVGGKRSYRALLRSERDAPHAMLLFPPTAAIESVRMEGEPVQPATERIRKYLNGWVVYECHTMPAKGVELNFTLPVGKSVEVFVLDDSFGLPPEGKFLLNSRPLTATMDDDGDVTIVSRRVQLIP